MLKSEAAHTLTLTPSIFLNTLMEILIIFLYYQLYNMIESVGIVGVILLDNIILILCSTSNASVSITVIPSD